MFFCSAGGKQNVGILDDHNFADNRRLFGNGFRKMDQLVVVVVVVVVVVAFVVVLGLLGVVVVVVFASSGVVVAVVVVVVIVVVTRVDLQVEIMLSINCIFSNFVFFSDTLSLSLSY